MAKKPVSLQCPTCESRNVMYRKQAGVYWCRRCGAEFYITKVAKGIDYEVIKSPLTKIQHFTKTHIQKSKPKRGK